MTTLTAETISAITAALASNEKLVADLLAAYKAPAPVARITPDSTIPQRSRWTRSGIDAVAKFYGNLVSPQKRAAVGAVLAAARAQAEIPMCPAAVGPFTVAAYDKAVALLGAPIPAHGMKTSPVTAPVARVTPKAPKVKAETVPAAKTASVAVTQPCVYCGKATGRTYLAKGTADTYKHNICAARAQAKAALEPINEPVVSFAGHDDELEELERLIERTNELKSIYAYTNAHLDMAAESGVAAKKRALGEGLDGRTAIIEQAAAYYAELYRIGMILRQERKAAKAAKKAAKKARKEAEAVLSEQARKCEERNAKAAASDTRRADRAAMAAALMV